MTAQLRDHGIDVGEIAFRLPSLDEVFLSLTGAPTADDSIPAALGATGLAILFGFCLSWVTVFIGVIIKSAEAVLAFSFIAFLPLQLGSSLASPTDTLPGWLGAWADINPVTHVLDACRALLNGKPDDESIGRTLLWSAILFVVFCPLAVRAYGRQE
ncbi:ABC transporter permease [Streptomyces olivoreticuli]|nr:ABC transporter permease [Streptomyces olivoreticuli]WKK27323.1 ABC transporter permease [Streptomyces olivoreticuli]